MPLVFVYGTLMRGGCRSGALDDEQFLDVATTKPFYRLYNCGTYPGIVASQDGVPVEGELWRVSESCLRLLDDIEGVDEGLYARRTIELQTPIAAEAVMAYFYLLGVSPLADIGTRWINE